MSVRDSDEDFASGGLAAVDGPPAVVLATAGYDHTIRFWDVVRGECIGTLQHNESQVNCLALTRDKLVLAVGGNPAIRLYDTVAATRPDANATVPPLLVLEGHGNVMSLGFTETHLWGASEEGMIRLWSLSDYICVREFSTGSFIAGATLHPVQPWLFIAGSGIAVWTIDGARLYEQPMETILRDVSISPDGNHAASIDHHGKLALYQIDVKRGEEQQQEEVHLNLLFQIQAHETYGIKCLFGPDGGCIFTTSADGTAKLFRIITPYDSATSISGSSSSSLPSTAELVLMQTFVGHTKWVWDCAFSADSAYILTASSDNTARLWDVQNAETIAVYTGHGKAITCLALNDLPSS
jgi:G protein beta subunit-like protein